MTSSAIAGVAVFALLAVLVAYTVPTLIQIRRTARAAEELLRGITPRIESATSNLDSVLVRTDRMMRGMEEGSRGITEAMGGLGALCSNLRPASSTGGGVSKWIVEVSSLISGVRAAWSAFGAAPVQEPTSETAHEGGPSHA